MNRPLPTLSPGLQAAGVVAVYALLAAIVMGDAAWSPMSALVGMPSIDSFDTVTLRRVVPESLFGRDHRSTAAFFPTGMAGLDLAPNLLDHLTAAPLVALLPFPLADNLWWWLLLTCTGLAGHRMATALTPTAHAGWIGGVGLISCEALVRDVTLHHAPQAMIFGAPLLVVSVLAATSATSPLKRYRSAAWAGLWLSVTALAYWYAGMFLVLGALPLLARLSHRQLAVVAAVMVVLCAPFLLPQLLAWDTRPLTAGMSLAPPQGVPASFSALADSAQFEAWHGVDPAFMFRASPSDISNRQSIALVVAAALGWRVAPRWQRWAFGWMAVLGSVMVLGPALRWGEELVLIGGHAVSLPFAWLGELHPFLDRLTWPERWGWLIPLGLVGLASHAPRPALWAGLIFIENLLVSHNLPVLADDVRHSMCWRDISGTRGAVLELPLDRRGIEAAAVATHGRIHGRPMVNPMLLPPSVQPPAAWTQWTAEEPLVAWLATIERAPKVEDPGAEAVRSLRQAGVGVIAIDVEPGGALSEGRLQRLRTLVSRHLGPPIDLGCAWVWWLDTDAPPPVAVEDPAAWRAAAKAWKENHPAPRVDTLIAPAYDRLRSPPAGKTEAGGGQ